MGEVEDSNTRSRRGVEEPLELDPEEEAHCVVEDYVEALEPRGHLHLELDLGLAIALDAAVLEAATCNVATCLREG